MYANLAGMSQGEYLSMLLSEAKPIKYYIFEDLLKSNTLTDMRRIVAEDYDHIVSRHPAVSYGISVGKFMNACGFNGSAMMMDKIMMYYDWEPSKGDFVTYVQEKQ